MKATTLLALILCLSIISNDCAFGENIYEAISQEIIDNFDFLEVAQGLIIRFDGFGNAHLAYVKSPGRSIRYIRFEKGTMKKIYEHDCGMGFYGGLAGLYVSASAGAYVILSDYNCGLKICAVDSSGRDLREICPEGYDLYNIGTVMPDGRYLFVCESKKGKFGIVDEILNISYIVDPEKYHNARSEQRAFSPCWKGMDRLLSFGGPEIFNINYAVTEGQNPKEDCMRQFGIVAYDSEANKWTKHLFIDLMSDSNVVRTELKYDGSLRKRMIGTDRVQIFVGYRANSQEEVKLCYFTIDKNLNLLPQTTRAVAEKRAEQELPQDQLEYQIMFFRQYGDRDVGFSGRLNYYQMTKDTIFYSASELIVQKAKK